MSKSTSQSNITATSVLELGKLAKFDDTTHLPDDAPPKSCCCACCAPCWTKFTDWLSNAWKTIAPCCIATGVIAAHLAIEVGEEVAKVKISGAPNLSALQKAALIAALDKTAQHLNDGITNKDHLIISDVAKNTAIAIAQDTTHLAVNIGTDAATIKINGASNLTAMQKAALIKALANAASDLDRGIDNPNHQVIVNIAKTAADLAITVGKDVAEVKINGAPNLDAIQKAALIAALEQASKTISGGMEDQSHVFTVNVPDHAIPLGGDSILHDVGNA